MCQTSYKHTQLHSWYLDHNWFPKLINKGSHISTVAIAKSNWFIMQNPVSHAKHQALQTEKINTDAMTTLTRKATTWCPQLDNRAENHQLKIMKGHLQA